MPTDAHEHRVPRALYICVLANSNTVWQESMPLSNLLQNEASNEVLIILRPHHQHVRDRGICDPRLGPGEFIVITLR